MSSIGRIFSVVNLILAALFLGWAANALNTNATFKESYEKETTAHKATKSQLEADVAKLRTEKQEAENKASRFMAERDEAVSRAERTDGDLKSELAKNAQFGADVARISATLQEIVASKDKLQADKDRAVQAKTEAEKARDGAVAASAEAEKKSADSAMALKTAQNNIADLEKTRTTLEKGVKEKDTQLASIVDATGFKLSDITSMPQIDARVLSVNTDVEPGLVALNVGESNGVKRGFTFEIFDGKTYKGQVRVDSVHPTTCSAVILRQVSGQRIRQGDSAATRL